MHEGRSQFGWEWTAHLLTPRKHQHQAGYRQGGVLTPASTMGLVLADRLRAAGITFDVVQSPALSKK